MATVPTDSQPPEGRYTFSDKLAFALACLAGIISIILSLVEKSRSSIIVFLAVMTGPIEVGDSDLHPAVTDTIVLTSEFDFPAFEAKCNVPCFFVRGLVVGSASKIERVPQGKDPTLAGAKVVEPMRLQKGQKVILEYMARDRGPISLIWSGRKPVSRQTSTNPRPQRDQSSAEPCPMGRIVFENPTLYGTTYGVTTEGQTPCVTINGLKQIGGKAALATKDRPDTALPSVPRPADAKPQ